MQHSSGLYLENSDMLDDLDDAQYTHTTVTDEHSTTAEQRTPRHIQSDWSQKLLREQETEQQKQQLRLATQKAHQEFEELLHQHPGFLHGADRDLMKRLSEMEAPDDPFCWESFPTPSTVPARPDLDLDDPQLLVRPLKELVDTDHIPNRLWFTSESQMIPALEIKSHTSIHVIEAAFILNDLCCTDQQIIDHYRDAFPSSLASDQILSGLISEGRWKAKCELWLPEELCLIRNAVSYDFLAAVSQLPSLQEMDWAAWHALRSKWAFYPKTFEQVSVKCAETQMELMCS